MSIDWSKAPEGATHWDTGLHGRTPGWMRLDGSTWHWWPVDGAKCERKWFVCCETYPSETKEFVARPVTWTGEGLPPVGITCKLSGPTERLQPINPGWAGRQVKIYAHFVSDRGVEMAAYVGEKHDIGGVGIAELFLPILTPGQIAAEERKAAIKKMQSDAECHVYADVFGRLYDAGYRKPVTP